MDLRAAFLGQVCVPVRFEVKFIFSPFIINEMKVQLQKKRMHNFKKCTATGSHAVAGKRTVFVPCVWGVVNLTLTPAACFTCIGQPVEMNGLS